MSNKESYYIKWVKRELEFMLDGDEADKAMYDRLLHMCKEFDKEYHPDLSVNYAVICLNRLFRGLVLKPLTGEDDEWREVADGLWQNKRCCRIFKGKDGRAYDIEGRIFRELDGTCSYTSKDSWVYIDFPYYPKSEYVDVEVEMSNKPYLADVQVGDKLYNFLKHNKEYTVTEVKEDKIKLEAEDDCLWYYHLYEDGSIPFYLYAPVNVLDPKNLPPRPWKPRKGEWVWCRHDGWEAWDLRQFSHKEDSWYFVKSCDGKPTKVMYFEIAPFKGELPPGLEEEDAK